MNFLIDNNLPPSIARALHELCSGEGHVVVSLRDRFPADTIDIHWITDLTAEGGWAVVSQDKFSKGNAERQAFRECGLPVSVSRGNGVKRPTGVRPKILSDGGLPSSGRQN